MEKRSDHSNAPCGIIAILASAGGLAPIFSILENVSVDSGVAFFILQHLSPGNENQLPDLLKIHCDLPVLSAEQGQRIRANHVYVSPPGQFARVRYGKVDLTAQKLEEKRSYTFDSFMESLAREQKEQAIVVILSGACDDGRIGAVLIREAGGIVLVQDPETAEFRSMPERVIESSAADIVLPPEDIAPMLMALVKDSQDGISLDENSSGYLRIMVRLKEVSHIDFSHYKVSTIKRRILRRMLLNKLSHDIEEYLGLIDRSDDEVQLLSRDLLIGVSSFFRDKGAFDALNANVLPRLLQHSGGRELRVWVAGCATGEEAYSLAILCLEFCQSQGLSTEVKILASDINSESIRSANKGIYSRTISDQLPKPYLEKYFILNEDNLQVRETLKQHVIFFKHDLTQDIPFSNVDLVSCRNVFIYLKPEIQRHVIRCFGFALRKGGVLMLSPSESVPSNSNFEILDERWRIYESVKKPRFFASPVPSWRMALDPNLTDESKKNVSSSIRRDESLRERLLQFLAGNYLPLVLAVNAQGEILYILGNSSDFLHLASGEPAIDLSSIADPNLRLTVSMGLKTLETKGSPLLFPNIPVRIDERDFLIDLKINKLQRGFNQSELILILFEKVMENDGSIPNDKSQLNLDLMSQQRISDLEEELYFTKQNLRVAIEDLEASNEELQSANEEMQSGNEELQSTNEELQSTNEELLIVNSEYKKKTAELASLNDDINNLMLSSKIINIFLDENKYIRLVSPEACQVLGLSPEDVGKPLERVIDQFENTNIVDLVDRVFTSGVAIEIEDACTNGRIYIIRINPFFTAERALSGVTVNFLDITTIRNMASEKAKLAAVVEYSQDPIIIQALGGQILSWNKGAEKLFGYSEEEALRMCADDLVPDSHKTSMKTLIRQTIDGQNLGMVESMRRTKSGNELFVNLTLTRLADENQMPYAIASSEHDITQQKQLAEEARLAAVAFETIDGIMVTDAKGNIVRVNESFSNITGYSSEQVLGKKPSILHSGRHDQVFYQNMWSAIHENGSWAGEIWNKAKDGRIYPSWLSVNTVRNQLDEVTHYIGVFRDVSENKKQEERIHRLAYFDSLTELPNRRLYSEKMEKTIALCNRLHVYGSLMFLDLDRFKIINDSLGHGVGDQLLVAVSKRLKNILRSEDFVARLGGDEFVIVTSELGHNLTSAATGAEKLAQKIIAAFDEPFVIDGHELNTSPSIGVTLFPNEEDTREDLLRQADNAMYLAKKTGRNTVRFFDPSLQVAADAWLNTEKALRKALKEQEFVLHYQPQFDKKGQVNSVEALVRWISPTEGMVPPDDFLPICEDTGLIRELGKWIVDEACRQLSDWLKQGFQVTSVAINVSATQFMSDSFETDIVAAIDAANLPGSSVEIEVTETLFLEDTQSVSDKMKRLKALGLRFAIDDYGTGYSSLSYIKKLPINKLKIDKIFIRDILTSADDACIVESTIAMAQKMGLEVISEGVEKREQMTYLIDCGCDNFQGFLFGPAVPADQLMAVIERQKRDFLCDSNGT